MKLRILCPVCELPGAIRAGSSSHACAACDNVLTLPAPVPAAPAPVSACMACGCSELFRKKDFPHGLGMAILVGAFVLSTLTYLFYLQWLTWVILLGSAAFDGILYLVVGDAITCYRCHADHLGVQSPESHQPFDLAVHEKYRQERIRREELQGRG